MFLFILDIIVLLEMMGHGAMLQSFACLCLIIFLTLILLNATLILYQENNYSLKIILSTCLLLQFQQKKIINYQKIKQHDNTHLIHKYI